MALKFDIPNIDSRLAPMVTGGYVRLGSFNVNTDLGSLSYNEIYFINKASADNNRINIKKRDSLVKSKANLEDALKKEMKEYKKAEMVFLEDESKKNQKLLEAASGRVKLADKKLKKLNYDEVLQEINQEINSSGAIKIQTEPFHMLLSDATDKDGNIIIKKIYKHHIEHNRKEAESV